MKKILVLLGILLFAGCSNSYKTIDVDKLDTLKDATYLDVRTSLEYKNGHIDGALNMDVAKVEKNIEDLIPNKDRLIVVYCQSGKRSLEASKTMAKLGYKNIYNLNGGYTAYLEGEL